MCLLDLPGKYLENMEVQFGLENGVGRRDAI